MRRLIIFLFYLPVVFSTVNAQAFLAKFTPASYSQVQIFAYFNVCAVIVGAFLIIGHKRPFSKPIKVWIFFYIVYYVLALIGNIVFESEPYKLLPSLVAVAYFFGFSVLLSIPEQRMPLARVLTFAFFCSCILSIIFNYFNIDMDVGGLNEFKLNRAGGVYGDANNSAISAIFSFLFINYLFVPKDKRQKIMKIIGICISIYAILITYSKTGFLVLLVVLFLAYRRRLNFKRVVFTLLLAPPAIYLAYNWILAKNWISLQQQGRIESIVNLLTFQTDKIDYSYRDVLLKNMFNYIEANPFIGHGVQFSNSIRGHNTIIGIWADAGIIAFLVFLFALLYFFRKALRSQEKIRFFALSILITFSVFMLSLQTVINQNYLMVVLALICYLIDQKANEDSLVI